MDETKNKIIQDAKKKYNDAKARGDTVGMESAHAEAEAERSKSGYSGGADGSQRISLNQGSWIGGKSVDRGTAEYGTYEEDLNRLTKAQRESQISQLKQARDKALHNLDVQEQSIKPTYQNARNQTSAVSQQNARSFAEYLANRGLTNSGASAQGEMNRLSALQNSLGNLNTAEANAYRDIANQRTAIENDYVSGLANADNAITAEYYKNLLNYNEQQRQEIKALQNRANYQYVDDIQARINELLAQGVSPNSREILNLQAMRGDKLGNVYQSSMANAMNNIGLGNINYNNAQYAGMTVPQAQAYYNRVQEQARAQAEAEAEKMAWERDLAERKYNLNYQNTMSLINSRGNNGGTKQYNVNEVLKMLENVEAGREAEYIEALYNAGNITDETRKILGSMRSDFATQNTSTGTGLKGFFSNLFNKQPQGIETFVNEIDSNYSTPQEIQAYIQRENTSGRMTDAEAIELLNRYGMSDIARQIGG